MLYNLYRPSDFSEVRGQDDVLMTLRKQSAERKFGHAYLLAGHRGTGKTTIARILSKAINCENPTENGPCRACASCQAAADSMDIIELDAASNNGVDKIKELMGQTKYRPVQLKNKVFIIDEAHNLSSAAFDALLKPLEEPPDFCTIILCTTELHKIPVTVKSRCESYQFHPIDAAPMRERLKEVLADQGATCDEDALNLIIRSANGGLRDALGLLEQLLTCCGNHISLETTKRVLGMLDAERILSCLEACVSENTLPALTLLDELLAAGKSPLLILDTSLQVLMDLITIKTTGSKASVVHSRDYLDALYGISQNTSFERLFWLSEQFCNTRNSLRNSADKGMDIRLLLIRASNRAILSCDAVELAEEVSLLKREVACLKERLAQSVSAPSAQNSIFAVTAETSPRPETEDCPDDDFFDAPKGIVPFGVAVPRCEGEDFTEPAPAMGPNTAKSLIDGADADEIAERGGMQQNRTETETPPQEPPAKDEYDISASDLFKILG